MNQVYTIVLLVLTGLVLTSAQTAFATNEGSYQEGYHQAISFYGPYCAGDPNADGPGCPANDAAISACYKGTVDDKYGTVTNSTACMDGYMNGWKHWCKGNVKDCADMATWNEQPTWGINRNKTAIQNATSSVIPRMVGKWHFVNESSGVSGTMTFALRSGDTSGPVMDFNQTIGDRIVYVTGSSCAVNETKSSVIANVVMPSSKSFV